MLEKEKITEEEPVEEKPTERKRLEDNVVFIGRKPSMSYVLAVITQFTNGADQVFIKARGKAIGRAVDVAEIVKRRFMQDVQVKNIEIGTEERELEDKTKLNVSTMTITLGK
jgi:DNA-binding protein